MRKLAIFSVLFMAFGIVNSHSAFAVANCPAGGRSIYYEGNQSLDDNEFIYVGSGEHAKAKIKNDSSTKKADDSLGGLGWECDNNYCGKDTYLLAPNGHYYKGNSQAETIYVCNTNMGDSWNKLYFVDSCAGRNTRWKIDVINGVPGYDYYRIEDVVCRQLKNVNPAPVNEVHCKHNGEDYNVGKTVPCANPTSIDPNAATAEKRCLAGNPKPDWGKCYVTKCKNTHDLKGEKCIAKPKPTPTPTPGPTPNPDVPPVPNPTPIVNPLPVVTLFDCESSADMAYLREMQIKYADNKTVTDYINKILNFCESDKRTKSEFDNYIIQLRIIINRIEKENDNKISDSTSIIKNAVAALNNLQAGFDVSVWKTAEGKFNTSRLVSDSVAGVVLGTAGGLITSNVMKKNQVRGGFEDISCTIGGQVVADWGDEFSVGIR